MRVALLGPHPVGADGSQATPPLAGGVDAVVVALARGLARHGNVDVAVVSAVSEFRAPRVFDADGYSVYLVPRPRGGRMTGQRKVVSALIRQIDAIDPDICHAHIAGVYARAALRSDRPAVITLHGIIARELRQAWSDSSWLTRLRWLYDARLEDRVVRDARNIIAISPYIRSEFAHTTQARYYEVENPVEDRFFDMPAPQGGERLLCVARVIPRKGIATLIQTFGEVACKRPQALLTVVGEMDAAPEYAAHCRNLARSLGLGERVIFTGGLSPEEVARELAQSDLVVLASEQETAPVSIAEAMAAGRPVVTTDVGGCAALVADGETGRVVAPRDPHAMAAAIDDLLGDQASLGAMGRAGRVAAEARFRADVVVAQTVQAYQSILRQALEQHT